MNAQKAFTLIELIAVMAVAAILLVVALPNLRYTLMSNRVTSKTNDFVRTMNLAKNEAVTRNTSVQVIPYPSATSPPGDNEWGKGWKIWVDVNRNSVEDKGVDIIKVFESTDSIVIDAQESNSFPIIFRPREVRDNTITFNICDRAYLVDSGKNHPLGRQLQITRTGNVKLVTSDLSCP